MITNGVSRKSVIINEEELLNFTNKKNSLTEMVYEQLISMLMNGDIIPGQIINRRQIAEKLGVSITPVVDALNLIEQDGLIETNPRRGTMVRLIHEQDTCERYLVREALECTAVRLYCGLPVRWNKDELMQYAEKTDKTKSGTIHQMREEIIFHASLINLIGIPYLTREFIKVARIGLFCMVNQVNFFHDGKRINHTDLLEQLTTDNPDDAEKAIREHIWNGKPLRLKYNLTPHLERN